MSDSAESIPHGVRMALYSLSITLFMTAFHESSPIVALHGSALMLGVKYYHVTGPWGLLPAPETEVVDDA